MTLVDEEIQVVTLYEQGPPGPGGAPGAGLVVAVPGRVDVGQGPGIEVTADAVGIADEGVVAAMIAPEAVTADKLDASTVREQVEDWTAALLVEGDNIALAYDDPAGTLTISVTGIVPGDIPGLTAEVLSIVGAALTDSATIALSQAIDGTISGDVLDSPTVAGLAPAYLLDRDNHTGEQDVSTINAVSLAERVQDILGAAVVAGDNVTVVYDDPSGTLTISVPTFDPGSIPGFAEAAQDAVASALTPSASIDFAYDDTANTITADVDPSWLVESAQDAVGDMVADTATATVTYDDATPALTVDVLDSPLLGGQDLAWVTDRGNQHGTQDASTISDFVDAVESVRLDQLAHPTQPVNLNGQRIINLDEPVDPGDASTKDYTDLASGRAAKAPVATAATAPVTISSPGGTIAGVALGGAFNQRVLLTGQALALDNGIYDWNGPAVPMTRSQDADEDVDMVPGFTVAVQGGEKAGSVWRLTTPLPIAVGVTALTFTEDSGLAALEAGAGLTKTGNRLDVGEGQGIVVDADTVQIGDGLVTGGGTSGSGGMLAPATVHRNNVVSGTLTDVEVAPANKDGAANVPSLRTLGTGAQQAAQGSATVNLSGNQTIAGTKSFSGPVLASGLPWADPRHPAFAGGAPVNGTSSDSPAIQAALDALVAAGSRGRIHLGPGTWLIDTDIVVPRGIWWDQDPMADIAYVGSGVALTFQGLNPNHDGRDGPVAFVRVHRQTVSWHLGAGATDTTSIGVRIRNAVAGQYDIHSSGFYTGVEVLGDAAGCILNEINLRYVVNNKRGLVFTQAAGGWTNQGRVNGGGIHIDSTYSTQVNATITNKALTANVATLTTAAPHGLPVGTYVTISGVDSTFNGLVALTAVTSTTLSYARVHADVASTASGGTAVGFVADPGTRYIVTNASNGWKFDGIDLEGHPGIVEVAVEAASFECIWDGCRYEGLAAGQFHLLPVSTGNRVLGGYSNFGPGRPPFLDEGSENIIQGRRGMGLFCDDTLAAILVRALTANSNKFFSGLDILGREVFSLDALGRLIARIGGHANGRVTVDPTLTLPPAGLGGIGFGLGTTFAMDVGLGRTSGAARGLEANCPIVRHTVITNFTVAGGASIDPQTGEVFTFNLSANILGMAIGTAPAVGTVIVIKMIQDATGGRTYVFPASFRWIGGAAPAPSSGPNLADIYMFGSAPSGLWHQLCPAAIGVPTV